MLHVIVNTISLKLNGCYNVWKDMIGTIYTSRLQMTITQMAWVLRCKRISRVAMNIDGSITVDHGEDGWTVVERDGSSRLIERL